MDKEQLKDKISVTQTAIRFSPVDLISYKLAYLLALDGQQGAALAALQRATATHPDFLPNARMQLGELAKRFPELDALCQALPEPTSTDKRSD